jgi:hypothetical protein
MTLARVRALLVVVTMAVLAATFVVWAIMRDSQTKDDTATARRCAEGEKPAATAIPEPKKLTINVYNDTDQRGLAKRVADHLKAEGFKVAKVAQDPDPNVVKGTAEIRFGPKGLGGAYLLSAYFQKADMLPDTERNDDTVDVVLGQEFKQIATPAEVNDALRMIGEPSPPAGMC